MKHTYNKQEKEYKLFHTRLLFPKLFLLAMPLKLIHHKKHTIFCILSLIARLVTGFKYFLQKNIGQSEYLPAYILETIVALTTNFFLIKEHLPPYIKNRYF